MPSMRQRTYTDEVNAAAAAAWRKHRSDQPAIFQRSWAINTFGQDCFLRKAREMIRTHERDFGVLPKAELIIACMTRLNTAL